MCSRHVHHHYINVTKTNDKSWMSNDCDAVSNITQLAKLDHREMVYGVSYSWSLMMISMMEHWLVVYLPLWNIRKSAPVIIPYGKIEFMFQTTRSWLFLVKSNSFTRQLLVGGFNPWKIWVRQLRWLFPIYGTIKVMFQSPIRLAVWSTPHPSAPKPNS